MGSGAGRRLQFCKSEKDRRWESPETTRPNENQSPWPLDSSPHRLANNRDPQAVLSQTCLSPYLRPRPTRPQGRGWSRGRLATCACAELAPPPLSRPSAVATRSCRFISGCASLLIHSSFRVCRLPEGDGVGKKVKERSVLKLQLPGGGALAPPPRGRAESPPRGLKRRDRFVQAWLAAELVRCVPCWAVGSLGVFAFLSVCASTSEQHKIHKQYLRAFRGFPQDQELATSASQILNCPFSTQEPKKWLVC